MSTIATSGVELAMNLPDLTEPWPVRFTGRPNFFSLSNDGKNPGGNDNSGKCEIHDHEPDQIASRQCIHENQRRSDEEGFRNGVPATVVLGELGVTLWEVSVDEDRDPDGKGEKNHCSTDILFLPEYCIKTMSAPKGSDGVTCEVNVGGGAYNGY